MNILIRFFRPEEAILGKEINGFTIIELASDEIICTRDNQLFYFDRNTGICIDHSDMTLETGILYSPKEGDTCIPGIKEGDIIRVDDCQGQGYVIMKIFDISVNKVLFTNPNTTVCFYTKADRWFSGSKIGDEPVFNRLGLLHSENSLATGMCLHTIAGEDSIKIVSLVTDPEIIKKFEGD